jgi:serine/threonine-protein kinase
LERATGVRKDDQRSDIYFAGCIYYHLLTGKAALYETKNRVERLSKTRFLNVVPIHKADPNLPAIVAHIVHKAMELDPERRYQSPGEMLADLTVAYQKLSSGNAPAAESDETLESVERELEQGRQELLGRNPRATLMLVESDVKVQDLFRKQLKDAGYRVLVISDPERALARFGQGARPADCLILSSRGLGAQACDAFGRFVETNIEDLSVVLLLDERHRAWASQAITTERHVIVKMPVKLAQFKSLLRRLLNAPRMVSQADRVPDVAGEGAV